ncbi:MAG: MATE family efflux transporter [Pseudomonadota bacterium]
MSTLDRNWPGHRELWRIAAPMILTNISIPLLGLVDTAVLGHLPDPAYLGAVAVGAMVFSFVFWGFGFLRMGTTGLTAQAFGREDTARVARLLPQALLLALACAALMLLLQRPVIDLALGVTEATAAVEEGARTYFLIRVWGAPFTLATHALVGWFLGVQNARAPMAMLLIANGVNVVLDLVFVMGLGWGVAGVAWASVIGEALAVIVGLLLAWRTGRVRSVAWGRVLDLGESLTMLRLNRAIALRTFAMILVFSMIPWWGARLGENILAANAVLMNLQHFLSYALDGFAHAAEAFVGRAVGAGRRAALRRAVRRTGLWTIGVAVVFCVAYAVGGAAIVRGLTDIESVRATALTYLPWLVVLPLVSAWCFWLDGVFIGATWGREMMIAMAASAFGVFLPAWWLTQGLGNHGLWLSFTLFMAARGLTMGGYWLRRSRTVLPAT